MARKSVLVIEFNPEEARAIGDLLRQRGYHALTAHNGAEGLRVFYEEYPDLVIVNLLMPDIQGAELINRLRQRDSREHAIRIIAINQLANASPFFIKRMGVDDQVTKPIDQQRLLGLVRRYIGEPDKADAAHQAAAIPPSPGPAKSSGKRPGKSEQPRKSEQLRRSEQPRKSRPEPDEGVPSSGSLMKVAFHQLLARIFRREVDGVLTVHDSLGDTKIHFHQGLPVLVNNEGFARYLMRHERLDAGQTREVRNRAIHEKISEQEVVLRLKVLPQEELLDHIRGFSYRAMRDLCRPVDDRFRWEEGPVEPHPPLNPAVAIMLGARRYFEAEKIHTTLTAKGRLDKPMVLALNPSRLPDLPRYPALQRAVEAARRGETIKQFLTMTELPNDEMEPALYALGLLKVISFDPADAWRPGPGEDIPTASREEPRPAPERKSAPEKLRAEPPPAMSQAVSEKPAPPPVQEKPAPPPAREKPTPPPPPQAREKPAPLVVETPTPAEPAAGPLTDKQLMQAGRQMLKSKIYSKAYRCFSELLMRNGDDPQVLLYYARAASRNRFVDFGMLDAVDALRRALSLNPRFFEARLELGNIFRDIGELNLAITEVEAVLSLDPQHTEATKELNSLKRRQAKAG